MPEKFEIQGRQLGPVPEVNVTASVAHLYDLSKFHGLQKSVLKELGCPACTSGHNIRWQFERDFAFDAAGKFIR